MRHPEGRADTKFAFVLTHELLQAELGDYPSKAHTLTISQAGENQVGIAGVVSDALRIHARGGGGCVMGSKNLKAIAVQGSQGLPVTRPDDMLAWSDDFRQKIDSNEAVYGFKRRGTLGAVAASASNMNCGSGSDSRSGP